ncbi:MAG: hypothetical protein AAGG44_01035 [Planctomycetota bacterium]
MEDAFESILADLTAAGFSARWCLTDADASIARREVTDGLKQQSPDVVVIGAGVRTDPDHFLLFEEIINIIVREAPDCRIAFNTLPFDTVDAVQRWV